MKKVGKKVEKKVGKKVEKKVGKKIKGEKKVERGKIASTKFAWHLFGSVGLACQTSSDNYFRLI